MDEGKPIPMIFLGGPTYAPDYLKDALKTAMFPQNHHLSSLNINSNNKEFQNVVAKTRESLRDILNIPNDHQIWFLWGGCHLQFAGIPLNMVGNDPNVLANYTTTGHFSKLAFREAKKYCSAKSIVEMATNQKGQFYLPDHYDLDPSAAFTHFVENQSVEGLAYPTEKFPVVEGVPLFDDCSSSFLTRTIDWSKVDVAYAHSQKNCGISGTTVMIVNPKTLKTNPSRMLPEICSFQNYQKRNGVGSDMNITPLYAQFISTDYIKNNGGLHLRKYQERSRRLYDVIDQAKIYRARVRKDFRSPINVTWAIENQKIMQECIQEAAKQELYEFKGHRAIGGLRASLFAPIPDESVYRLADFLEDFAQKYQ